MINGKFDGVIEILHSESHDLLTLARLSGRDPFRFYNGADLKNIDLSGQSLHGLNFDHADLRFSNLTEAHFDVGCFNRSLLDSSQSWLRDDYDFNCEDIIGFPSEQILAYVTIRAGIIDELLPIFGINYKDFSSFSKVNLSSLRKARNGKVVSIETAQNIFKAILNQFDGIGDDLFAKYVSVVVQPCASILMGGSNIIFEKISPERLESLTKIRKFRIEYRKIRNPDAPDEAFQYRDTAENLKFYERLMKRSKFYG